jgi:hypothetical protein
LPIGRSRQYSAISSQQEEDRAIETAFSYQRSAEQPAVVSCFWLIADG